MARGLIKEVILENFMSYRYGRIRLKPGFNFITGPNGAGKSAILLGISLAMGMTSTERSRRLSDLVRRGEEIGRISLILDNSQDGRRRPFPMFNKDEIMLSRYIRKDGSYWFEIDYREASRAQVSELLQRAGIDPENYLIIMPQGVIDEFILVKPQDKLRMVEEALGIASIRARLIESSRRLQQIISEETQYKELIERAMEELQRWKEEYDRLVRARELEARLEQLRVELYWANVGRIMKSIESVKAKIEQLRAKDSELKERESRLEQELKDGWASFDSKVTDVREMAARAFRGDERALAELNDGLSSLRGIAEGIEKSSSGLAVASYMRSEVARDLRDLEGDLSRLNRDLEELRGKAPAQVVESPRQPQEVEDEIKTVGAELKALGQVDQQAEKVYLELKGRLDEYREKLRLVGENKERTLDEVRKRMEEWKSVIRETVERINKRFNEIMSQINASGKVVITDEDDPENAGIRIYASFSGSDLIPLDSFSQSGGELSASVTAFLLAVQTYVVSPFRALDEFDVHMDPIVREKFIRGIYEITKEQEAQYVIITPSFPSFYSPEVNYVVVQKTQSGSAGRQVKP